MKQGKAPGPVYIPEEVLKLVSKFHPQMLLDMYNKCLVEGTFPKRWKISRLVVLDKGKGDINDASAYRPLCLLDSSG